MTTLFAFLHHAAAFALVAAVTVEFVLVKGDLNATTLHKLALADRIIGIAAGVVLLAGLARVFHFEKGAAYYFHSWPFIGKLLLFIVTALASIYPTIQFIRWSKGQTIDAARLRTVRAIIHAELAAIVLILLFAAMMARGVGFFG